MSVAKSSVEYLSGVVQLGDGYRIWHPTRSKLGVEIAPGTPANTPPSSIKVTVDRDAVVSYLTAIAPYVRRTPINARPILLQEYQKNNPIDTRSDSTPIPAKILPGRDGAMLLVDPSADTIVAALTANAATQHIVLVTQDTPPTVTANSLVGINARIGHFVTHFNPGEEGRTETVRKAISLIDGHVVPPNAIFSVNDTVGERTAARGFGIGYVFIDGHLDKQVGGGMCQVATTLYNAALLANQKIVERHQHIRTVPYVEPGDDATVWFGEKDLRFQNTSGAPIYISYRTTATHAICDLYGKADPDTHVDIEITSKCLGPRNYTGVLKRIVKRDGKVTNDYTSYSEYKWTSALDYNM